MSMFLYAAAVAFPPSGSVAPSLDFGAADNSPLLWLLLEEYL
jgi:hypothetical protein